MIPGASERRIELDGVPIRWFERGDGLPVVLIHGIPTSPALWRHVAPLLLGTRVLAFEMVGYGSSWAAAHDHEISVRAQADYLLRWLDALDVSRALFVGHDLGGGVAQIAAVREPDRCAGLVLSNAVAYDSWPIPSVRAARAAGALIERLPPSVLRLHLAFLIRQGHDDAARARESLDAHWHGYAHRQGGRAFVAQMRSLNTADTLDIADRLAELQVPAAVVWGEADRFQKIRYGRRLAADLSAPLDAIPGGRHFVPEDHPDRMAAAIERLARDLAPSGTACAAHHGGVDREEARR